MVAPYFPIALDSVNANLSFTTLTGEEFAIGSVKITPIPLSHPNGGFGYRFSENGKTFVFLTDNELEHQHPGGLLYHDYVEFCRNADLLIHDSEFTDAEYVRTRSWGHSRYRKAVELACEAGVSRFGLFHHNQDRTDSAMLEIVQDCQHLARAKHPGPECFAMTQTGDFVL